MVATRLLRFQEDINPKPILNSDTHEHIPIYEQLHKQGKGNFKNDWYRTSTSLVVDFGSGNVSKSCDDDAQVRAVRALP